MMAVGIGSVSLLGADAGFLSLMPSFAVIGIGGGLTVPLTASVLDAMPRGEAGVASGIFNASREVSGLLGITVIGAVLTARQSVLLTAGETPTDAFLGGYQAGLLLAAGLVALGGVAAYVGLRKGSRGRHAARDRSCTTPTLRWSRWASLASCRVSNCSSHSQPAERLPMTGAVAHPGSASEHHHRRPTSRAPFLPRPPVCQTWLPAGIALLRYDRPASHALRACRVH